jgi:hypothetical protein
MIRSGGGQTSARIWYSFLIFAAPAFWQRQARRGVLASWLFTGVLLVVAGMVAGQRRLRRRCGHRSRTSAGPGLSTSMTWANAWQVQDSNLGRLSSAIYRPPTEPL